MPSDLADSPRLAERTYTLAELASIKQLFLADAPPPSPIQVNTVVNATANAASHSQAAAVAAPRTLMIPEEKRRAQNLIRHNPWVSGSFYLAVVLSVLTLLLVTARTVPWWAFPIVVIGTVLLVCVIGAMQLRNDGRLSQKNFLELVGMTFRELPLLRTFRPNADSADPGVIPAENETPASTPK